MRHATSTCARPSDCSPTDWRNSTRLSEEGLFTKVLTTNVVYQTPELLSREYYISCDLSKYIALIIDKLNHDASISGLLDPADRIQKVIKKFKNHEKI